MPALVTPDQVKAIYPTTSDLTPFVTVADLLVQENLSGKGLSRARLVQIELYLAAHFALVTLERGGLTRRKIGDSEDFYQAWTNSEIGFAATRFGQQASLLDTSGTLAQLGTAKLKAQFKVVSRTNGRFGQVGVYDDNGSGGGSCP